MNQYSESLLIERNHNVVILKTQLERIFHRNRKFTEQDSIYENKKDEVIASPHDYLGVIGAKPIEKIEDGLLFDEEDEGNFAF